MVGCGVLDLGGRDADVAIGLRETLLFSGMDGKSNGFNVRLSLRMPVRRSEVGFFSRVVDLNGLLITGFVVASTLNFGAGRK